MKLVSMPISQLATVQSGGGAPQDVGVFTRTGFPFIRAGSLSKLLDGAKEDSLELIEPEVADKYGLKLFPAGTVLLAKSGMSAMKGHVYRLRKPAYVVNHLAALIPHEASDSAFLGHGLRLYSPTSLIKDPAYPSIRLGDIESMRIQAPASPRDRERIAEILDKADELRAKRRAALKKLDELTQSIFLDMFGDPATNPKGWPIASLGDVILNIRNGVNREQRTDGVGWPITRIETISDGIIDQTRVRWIDPNPALLAEFRLEVGDILFSHINSIAHIGKTALYAGLPELLIHGINLLRVRPNREAVEPVWLLHILKHDVVRTHFRTRCKPAVNQASLNQSDIKCLQLFLPPLPLQRNFVRTVQAVDTLGEVQRAGLSAIDQCFASLQHRAFRGEL